MTTTQPDARRDLEDVIDLDMLIQAKKEELEELYRRRDQKYIDAQEHGATLREIAAAAGVSRNGVIYMLKRAKERLA